MFEMPWVTTLIIGCAIACGFFVQTIVGFAAVLVALPILLIVMDLQSAIVLLSLLLALFSIILIIQNHGKMEKYIILELAVSGFVGMMLGIYTLKLGNPEILKQVLGGFIIVYALHAIVRDKKIALFQRMGWLFGLVGGYFSGLFNTGGPLYVTYINNKLDDAHIIRATILGVLGFINISRLPLLVYNEMIDKPIVIQSICMVPIMLLSIVIGNRVYANINQRIFKKVLFVLLVVVGFTLLWE